jgi:CubicO group peptidase (beta-lactamase class C family)
MAFALISHGSPLPHEEPHGATVPWWSFTKTVLSAASLTLVRDGLVGLDEAVPEAPFTLRHLLRHEAGLADYGELPEYHAAVARHEAPWPEAEMLQRLDATRLRHAPGAGWRYSNVGYLYVARLIERVTGLALQDALLQRALAPLGVAGVRLAQTLGDVPGAPAYHPGWVYHGLLVGPLSGAVLFLDGLLAGQLLPDALLREMQTARHLGGPIPGRPWASAGYGLGLMQGSMGAGVAGLRVAGHTGVGPGSVVAVYRGLQGARSATCAVFHEGADEGRTESEVVDRLSPLLMR